MQHIKHAIISCAGVGSRLGLDIPKCLVSINGKPLIEYQLELLKDIPDIRIIVGFKEHEVIDLVKAIRSDITFVRNPDFLSTSNSYSIYLASQYLTEPYIIMDGDLLIEPKSFSYFLKIAKKSKEDIIGITNAKTEESVFVEFDKSSLISSFQRNPKTEYEWCGVAYIKNISIIPEDAFVFNQFQTYMPLKACKIKVYEIDTPEDLKLAIKFSRTFTESR